MINKLFAKGLSINQIDYLMDEGYTPSEILSMSIEKLKSLFENTKMVYNGPVEIDNAVLDVTITASPPDGYIHIPVVPDGGGVDEWFHPKANTNPNTIANIVSQAKSICQNVFYSTETSLMRWSYYLYGEWGEDPGRENWLHEGIDMQYHITKPQVTSRANGTVVHVNSSSGDVTIHDFWFGANINYQHLMDIPDFIEPGTIVYTGTRVGYVNPYYNHAHVQVCDHGGQICQSVGVHSNKDLELDCVSPYGILLWYAKIPGTF